jgi:hypothetical protein
MRLVELEGEFTVAKQQREEAHQRRKAAKEALAEAEIAWAAANDAVRRACAEKRLLYEE